MALYRQNDEITIADSALVSQNSFLTKTPDNEPLPIFDEVRDRLPVPLWDGQDDVIRCYWRAWELAFSNLRRPEPNTRFVSNFIDTAFNGCLFMWDSAFILMFAKYADKIFKFQKTLDNMYSHQHKDGFICREIDEKTGCDRFTRHDPSATGPEVMAWCEWEYYLNFGDRERLSKVFAPLMAYHRWMKSNHTWPDGTYFSSGWGCGMDNIPRQPAGCNPAFSHGHMIWVDACMQELNCCNVLIKMARELDKRQFIDELTAEAELLEKVINEKLWDEETGFYYDLWRNGEHNMVRHVGAFWALVAKCADQDRAERMIAYLEDENEFKTPHRIPTLSKSHEKFSPDGDYWCGGVWAPTNYMVLKGLDEYGKFDLSHRIGVEHLMAVTDVFKREGTLFENYAPEYSAKGNPAKADFVGWTGLAPISVLFEFVFGIKPKANENKIIWQVELLERHGVERYPFGKDGELTLICNERSSADERPNITVKSNVPVEIEVFWGAPDNRQSMMINA